MAESGAERLDVTKRYRFGLPKDGQDIQVPPD
jgi:hypothetical protein